MNAPTADLIHALALAIQGIPKPIELEVAHDATAGEILACACDHTGRDDLIELMFEDAEQAIGHAERVLDELRRDFRLLHAGTGEKIAVTLTYEGQHKTHPFHASATIRRVIEWAIAKHGFDLEGTVAEFQIKADNRVLAPDLHLGQAAHHACALVAVLVHNIKPQG